MPPDDASELLVTCAQQIVESHRPSLFRTDIGRVADFDIDDGVGMNEREIGLAPAVRGGRVGGEHERLDLEAQPMALLCVAAHSGY
jgi:hypothetical protein